MDFFAELKLKGDGTKGDTELIATGPLFLEAREGGKIVFSRKLDLRYMATQEGEQWRQRLEVREGQEDVFIFGDIITDQESVVSCHKLSERDHIKFVIFTELLSRCLQSRNCSLKTWLNFENPPPGSIQILLELCGGRAH